VAGRLCEMLSDTYVHAVYISNLYHFSNNNLNTTTVCKAKKSMLKAHKIMGYLQKQYADNFHAQIVTPTVGINTFIEP
jgi:hypothetical protein